MLRVVGRLPTAQRHLHVRAGVLQPLTQPDLHVIPPKQTVAEESIEYQTSQERRKQFLFVLDALLAPMYCAALQEGVLFFGRTKFNNTGSVEDINLRR